MTTRMPRQPTTQFTARLPAELHTWLAERAQKNHRSANAELAAILSALHDSETVARSMRPADHVCPDCKLPSAYGRMSDNGLCRNCELWRDNERHTSEVTP